MRALVRLLLFGDEAYGLQPLFPFLRRPHGRPASPRVQARCWPAFALGVLSAIVLAALVAVPARQAYGSIRPVIWAGVARRLTAAISASSAAVLLTRGAYRGAATDTGLLSASVRPGAAVSTTRAAPLPVSVNLAQYSPPVVDQRGVASCTAWVTGYYLRGWYARRDGYYPTGPDDKGGFAPMYIFSQVARGRNSGTTFAADLNVETAQGIDTRADYIQGDTDYADRPTPRERGNAAAYKITSYTSLFVGDKQGTPAQYAIEASIARGDPVAIGLPVYDPFWSANARHPYVDVVQLGTNHGDHAVFAARYDAHGLWVENEWGTGWGLNGWAELSWRFVNRYVWQAVVIHVKRRP